MIGTTKQKIIGVTRVRNVEFLINDILNYLSDFVEGVIVFDDASEDDTLMLLKKHDLVIEIIENKVWETDRIKRSKAEGQHRQLLFEAAKRHNADWTFVFDVDEFVEFRKDLDLTNLNFDSYYFRLFDFYITEEDKNKHYRERLYLGPEYRDIPMLFRSNLELNFHSRVPSGFNQISFGGYVKHYGKAISLDEWDKKCHYYINHLKEKQPGNIDISDKWRKRLGKAIHEKSDFNHELIKWNEKELFGLELTTNLERLSTLKLTILVATSSLNSIGGSETFTFTLLEELKKYPNFDIEYFTFNKGFISEKIENSLGVNYMSRKKYDLILTNHNSVVNKLHKKGLVIQTCHGIYPKLEQPSKKANGFVSISQEVQNHLANKGFSSKIIHNSINVTRFFPKNKINKELKTVLSLCHSDEANDLIKKLAKDLDLKYLQAYKYKDPIWNIEDLINKADLVFGLGRSAYEAMSCGRPVIVYDKRRYFPSYGDGYVKDVLGFSLINNCSGRYSKNQLNFDDLKKEIFKYNAEDQIFFRDFAIKELDVRNNIAKYIDYFLMLKQQEINNRFFTKIKLLIKKIKNKSSAIFKKIFGKLKLFYK